MRHEPRILGAPSTAGTGKPRVLDHKTRQEPTKPEIHVHEDQVTTGDKIRQNKAEEGDPEIRVRNSEVGHKDFLRMLDQEGD